DAARFVEAVRGVDEAQHPVLHEVAEVDGMRHRSGDATRDAFDEGEIANHAVLGTSRLRDGHHVCFSVGTTNDGLTFMAFRCYLLVVLSRASVESISSRPVLSNGNATCCRRRRTDHPAGANQHSTPSFRTT